MSKKNVLITGVSSGIGLDAAEYLIGKEFTVYGTLRTTEQAKKLSSQLGPKFSPLVCDVCQGSSVKKMAEELFAHVGETGLCGLVNNAGITISGPLLHLPVEELKRQYEVNVYGVLRVIQATALLVGACKDATHRGRIINISSISDQLNFPMAGPYCSSKHALLSLTECLRRELTVYGIPVILVEPGNVKTDIWKKLDEISPYLHTDFGNYHQKMLDSLRVKGYQQGSHPLAVSKAIYHALTAPKPKFRYLMPGARWREIWKTVWKRKLLPRKRLEKQLSIRKEDL